MGTRTIVNDVTVSYPITLGDLRWLVAQCEGKSPDSVVEVQAHRMVDARDADSAEITIHTVD